MTEREEQLAYWEEDSDDDEEQNRCPCNGLHERCLLSSSLSLEAETFLNFSDDDEDAKNEFLQRQGENYVMELPYWPSHPLLDH